MYELTKWMREGSQLSFPGRAGYEALNFHYYLHFTGVPECRRQCIAAGFAVLFADPGGLGVPGKFALITPQYVFRHSSLRPFRYAVPVVPYPALVHVCRSCRRCRKPNVGLHQFRMFIGLAYNSAITTL